MRINKGDNMEIGITENVEEDISIMTKGCSVSLTRVDESDLTPQQPICNTDNKPMRRTSRKRTIPDNSKLLDFDEVLDLDTISDEKKMTDKPITKTL